MIKVAITGNIASGKSTVQKILESKGFKVLDTDILAHDLLDKLSEIKLIFKNFDITDGEKISREKLGKIVFSNQELKNQLEKIIHPVVKSKILEFFKQTKDEELVFVGIPLLFESNMHDIFDKILLIYSDDNIRKKRLISRNNYTDEYAEVRIKSQISQDKKKDLCDFIIYNNGKIDELKKSVDEFLSKIISKQA